MFAFIQECLISGRLETAASYLIILQNLEKPIASRQVGFYIQKKEIFWLLNIISENN